MAGASTLLRAMRARPPLFRARRRPAAAVPQGRLDGEIEALLRGIGARSGAALLTDGLEAFALRAGSARGAARTLDLQYYAWHDDVTGRLLAREVLRAADRGVWVRLLLDDTAVLGAERAMSALAALDDHASVEVRLFNPQRWRCWGHAGFALELALGGWHLNHRMHNKSWVADGGLAILGGRNIGDEYFDASGDFNFRDLDLAVAGRAAAQATAVFERYWRHRLARPVARCAAARPAGGDLDRLRASLDALDAAPGARPYLERLRASAVAADVLRDEGRLLPADGLRVAADPPEKATGAVVAGTLVDPIVDALRTVRREAVLISPYFVPGEAGAEALVAMAARGVRISVVTNSLAATDVVAVHGGYSRYRKKLLTAGVELFELKRSGDEDGGVLGSRGASLHTKAFALDGEVLFVGSYNLDPRSANLNTEMGAFAREPELCRRLLAEHARLTDPERSYRVGLEDGRLVWSDEGRSGPRVQRHEPAASLHRRVIARIVSWLPIESQL